MRARPKDLAAFGYTKGHKSNRTVGWTYESDQEAISEARSTLEDLETEKEEEDLQYRIDQLEKTIDFLEAIPDSAELEAQKEVYNEWIALITESNEAQLDILTELQNAYTSIGEIASNIQTWIDNDETSLTSSAYEAYSTLTDSSANTEGSLAAASEAASLFQEGGDFYNGAGEGTEAYAAAAEVLNQALSAMKEQFQNIDSLEQNYLADDGSGLKTWDALEVDEQEELAQLGFSQATWAQLVELYDDYLELQELYKGLDTTLKTTVNAVENETRFSYDTEGDMTEFVIDTGVSYGDSSAMVTPNDTGFNRHHKKTTALLQWNSDTQSWDELTTEEGDYWEYPSTALDDMPAGTLLASATDNKDDKTQYAYKSSQGEWLKVVEAAEGSMGLPGGPTLINEEGLEGIITPAGTLTSLPAKTGVVPATLTSNLSDLGEVAPNLIKSLDSLDLNYEGTSSLLGADDHSTNIQTLYATFQAEEGFDFDNFLTDVRSVINTTRHSG